MLPCDQLRIVARRRAAGVSLYRSERLLGFVAATAIGGAADV
jgi:hypothetical protein